MTGIAYLHGVLVSLAIHTMMSDSVNVLSGMVAFVTPVIFFFCSRDVPSCEVQGLLVFGA